MRLSNPCLAGKFTPQANVALVRKESRSAKGTNRVGIDVIYMIQL